MATFENLSHIQPETCSRNEWNLLIEALHSGEEVQVSEAVYCYFLERLPPVTMGARGFVFREGAGDTIIFRERPDGHSAQLQRRPRTATY